MKSASLGRWYIGFGCFLALCGVLGFASNPAEAKTALISGGTFGFLCVLWGIWMRKGGGRLAVSAAAATTLLLCGAFTWRAVVSWQAVAQGEPKRIAASLITVMLIASGMSMWKLIRTFKP